MQAKCKGCGAKLGRGQTHCPACGVELPAPSKLLPMAAFFLIVILVIRAYMDKPESDTQVPAAATPATQAQ
ncbi:MAG: hypothetical protein CMK72_08700 [Pseudomonadaceae bacterium]|nr:MULTISPECIES: hypothetical protein [Pseudomonas]MBQ54966.1 hypothetical protein [Pseudomonadaceae bacterium]OEO26515.1 hypothetical protein AX279_06810 [Pseudomonas sp. J237]HCP54140.1 hypothetical protein [Pseudomonas sp.]